MADRQRTPWTSILHVRVTPALRSLIDQEAELRQVAPSSVIRGILTKHYEVE
jgi:hypothetical protein